MMHELAFQYLMQPVSSSKSSLRNSSQVVTFHYDLKPIRDEILVIKLEIRERFDWEFYLFEKVTSLISWGYRFR